MKFFMIVAASVFIFGCQQMQEVADVINKATKEPDPSVFHPVGDHAELTVDSMASGASLKRYVLVPHESVDSSGLQYQQFVRKMRFALEKSGLVYDEKQPEIAIVFYYGIGAPKTTTKTYAIPIFGQTGYSSAYTTGSVTHFTPQTGVVGYAPVQETTVSFDRYLKLMTYDLAKTKEEKKLIEVWELSIVSTGPSNDMRRVFPYMTVASIGFINKDSGQKKYIELYDNDEKFVELQNLK